MYSEILRYVVMTEDTESARCGLYFIQIPAAALGSCCAYR